MYAIMICKDKDQIIFWLALNLLIQCGTATLKASMEIQLEVYLRLQSPMRRNYMIAYSETLVAWISAKDISTTWSGQSIEKERDFLPIFTELVVLFF